MHRRSRRGLETFDPARREFGGQSYGRGNLASIGHNTTITTATTGMVRRLLDLLVAVSGSVVFPHVFATLLLEVVDW
jgi:hypothetical protein